jgi:hypothetical protein
MGPRTRFPDWQFRILNFKTRTRPSGLEKGFSIFILFILAGIGATVFGLQFRDNQANDSLLTHTFRSQNPDNRQRSQRSRLDVPIPGNLIPSGRVEVFQPENLSDKIDGKAELYLSSGVRRLTTQRFRLKDTSDAWIELFEYDMATPRNGFAVYSGQLRPESVRLNLTPFSYRTENALFFLSGHTYVEIIGSGSTQEEVDAREALAEALVRANPGTSEAFGEFLLFPEPHLDRQSIALLSTDAFGFERLDNVFTASYDLDGSKVTVFLSRRESASQALELASAYYAFLLENGGRAIDSKPINGEKVRLVEILDAFELILTQGRILGGVREAPDQITAERIGQLLLDRLAETQPRGETSR